MKDLGIIGAEVYAVLSKVSKDKYDKIPLNVIKTFEKYKNIASSIKIVPSLEFKKQEISSEAKDIIFVIALNYWLTEQEKEKVIEKMKKNDEKKNITFNYDNLFKTLSKIEISDEASTEIIEKKKKN